MTGEEAKPTTQQTEAAQSGAAHCRRYRISGRTCPERPIDAEGFCLFHSENPGKDVKVFNQGIQQKLRTRDCDFSLYCFPREGGLFNNVEFNAAAYFNGAKFLGPAFFEGADFKQGVGFTDAEFHDLAWFRRTRFGEHAIFRFTTFSKKANFDGAVFERIAKFEKTPLGDEISFEGAKFLQLLEVENVDFPKGVGMRAVQFGPRTEFRSVNVTGTADFGYTTFGGIALFERINASDLNLRGADFFKAVSFSSCEFAEADFSYVTFAERAVFYLIKFLGKSTFNGLESAHELGFAFTTFTGETSFKNMKLTGPLKFEADTFRGPIAFDRSSLTGGIEFVDSSLYSNMSFERIRAEAELSFEKTWVWEECKSISFKGARFADSQTFDGQGFFILRTRDDLIIDFSTATLAKVVFYRSFPAYRCRFSGCRGLDEAIFEGVDWGRRQRTEKFGLFWHTRHAVLLDEEIAREPNQQQERATPYAEVERLYRLLRKSHTARMDAPQTSDFYYGEMEMRRLARPEKKQLRFWETLYWVFGGYGEVWTRPLLWFLVLVLACAALYGAFGLRTSRPNALNAQPDKRVYTDINIGRPKGAGDLLYSSGQTLLHSLKTAALLGKGSGSEVLNGPGQVVETLETILGPVLLALSVLAVRRQFPR